MGITQKTHGAILTDRSDGGSVVAQALATLMPEASRLDDNLTGGIPALAGGSVLRTT